MRAVCMCTWQLPVALYFYTVGYNRHYEETCQFRKFFGESYPEARSMWHHCRFWSKSIEVIYVANNGDKILTHAYFYYDPHVRL